MEKFDNNKIIGCRFGKFTATKLLADDIFECISEDGEIREIPKADLLSLSFLKRFDACFCCLEYGSVTDYNYEGKVRTCSFCGAPQIYAKHLCRSCYTRYRRSGSPHYVFERKKQATPYRTLVAEGFSLSRNYEDAQTMADLYKQGWTYQQIGDHFGISRQRVHTILHTKYKRNY